MPGGGESTDDVGGSAFNRHFLRQLLSLPDSETTSLLHTLFPPLSPLEPEKPPPPPPPPPPSSKVKARSTTVRIPIPRNLPPGPWEPLQTSTPPPPPAPEEPLPLNPSSKLKASSTTVKVSIPRSLPPGPWEPLETSHPPPIADFRKPQQYRGDPGDTNAALGSASQNHHRQKHLNGFYPNQMHYYRHPCTMNPRYSKNEEISVNVRTGYSNCESAANPRVDRWPRDQRDDRCAPTEYNRMPSAHAARYQYKMNHMNFGGFRNSQCWKPKNTEQGRSHGSAEKKMSKLEWVPVIRRQAEKLNLEERDESQQGVEDDDELQTVSFNDHDQIECAAVCKLHIEELAVESPDDFEGGSPSEVEPEKQEVGELSSEGDARQEDGLSDDHIDSMKLLGYPSQKELEIYPQASLVKCTGSNSLRGQHRSSQSMTSRRIECRPDIETLTSCFLSIYDSLLPAADKKYKQNQLLQSLAKPINKEWPSAKLHLYGSCANSFGFPDSDVDICLAIDDHSMSKHDMLLKLADILQSEKYHDVEAITNTRVPIVKMTDLQSGVSCDVCINNLLAVANTKLLRDYSTIDNRMHQLAFIVKHWARSREVNEPYQGTLSSYAYVIMCIHFLQQRRPAILPCLQEMEITYKFTVEDIECAYFDQVDKLVNFGAQNKESIAKLVWEFFQYWVYYHNYTSDVISIRTGTIVSKQMKNWTKRVGHERHLFCIEDPFETSRDLGCVVDTCSLKILRDEFERAAHILQHDPNPCVSLFQQDEPRIPFREAGSGSGAAKSALTHSVANYTDE